MDEELEKIYKEIVKENKPETGINYEKTIVSLKKILLEVEKSDLYLKKHINRKLLDETLKNISEFSLELGSNKNSDQSYWLKQYVFYNFAYILNKESSVSNYDLYSYRYINKFCLQDLINREITVVEPKMFNDPTDCPLFTILDLDKTNNCEDVEDIMLLKDAYSFMKIRCFVSNRSIKTGDLKQIEAQIEEYKNFLMWSHYADSHKGICLKYRLNRDYLKFNYSLQVGSDLMDVKYEKKLAIIDRYTINGQTAFATKSECWSYENEVRLLHYDPNCNSPVKALPLGENGNVEAVYFGLRCPQKDMDTIRGILKEEVAYFQMKEDEEDIFNLVEVPKNKKAEEMLEAASKVVAEN